jgi:hypothetical protein
MRGWADAAAAAGRRCSRKAARGQWTFRLLSQVTFNAHRPEKSTCHSVAATDVLSAKGVTCGGACNGFAGKQAVAV